MEKEKKRKRISFKIPLQTEVSQYIKNKMGWPQKFCDHYAERFWSFYNSNGWKVSGRAPMKSWESAFNANWQDLKWKSDVDYLNKCIASDTTIPADKKGNSFLNECLRDHSKNWDKIKDESYAQVYDYMKDRKLVVLSSEERNKAVRFSNGNITKGKALCVKLIFDRMITHNEKFA